MIYTAQTAKAMIVSYNAHHGQVDKCDVPYIFHPMHLAEQMEDEKTTVLALLHDVVEDTDLTLDDLREMDFDPDVLEALALLTHDASVPYFDYVDNLKSNPLARAVKLADLRHNSDLSRKEKIDEYDLKRNEKYAEAIRRLTEV